jgi:hypothetical protein
VISSYPIGKAMIYHNFVGMLLYVLNFVEKLLYVLDQYLTPSTSTLQKYLSTSTSTLHFLEKYLSTSTSTSQKYLSTKYSSTSTWTTQACLQAPRPSYTRGLIRLVWCSSSLERAVRSSRLLRKRFSVSNGRIVMFGGLLVSTLGVSGPVLMVCTDSPAKDVNDCPSSNSLLIVASTSWLSILAVSIWMIPLLTPVKTNLFFCTVFIRWIK